MSDEPLTLAQEIEIRNLYLYENWKPSRIAEHMLLDNHQVQRFVTREGLPKKRAEGRELATQTAASTALRTSEALASKAEQHALKALDRTGEALEEGNARDASSFASTARSLVGIARAVLTPGGDDGGPRVTNLFFVDIKAPTPASPADADNAIPVEVVPVGAECLD